MKMLFVDTETTGLDLERHEVWEIAIIQATVLAPAVVVNRYHFLLQPTWLEQADPGALRVNRFYARTRGVEQYAVESLEPTGQYFSDPFAVAKEVAFLCEDALLVGNNPAFDEMFLAKLCREHDQTLAPFHRKINVVDMALGWLHARHSQGSADLDELLKWEEAMKLPHSSTKVLDAAGCPSNENVHTAMGDAEHVRGAFLHLTGATS